MPSVGPLELVILLVIVLVVFGPKRLPGLGKQLGSGMREFKDSLTAKADEDDEKDARDAFGQPAAAPERETTTVARDEQPEVVSGEARPQDQPAPRSDG